MTVRNEKGQFCRIKKEWSLENFDEGFSANLNGKQRFRVYNPDHPRSTSGYVLRSVIAYEQYHGVVVPRIKEIHHINGNTLDDSRENLLMLSNSEHQKTHSRLRGSRLKRICQYCDKEFEINRYRLNDKTSPNRGTYCSPNCYHKSRIGKHLPGNGGKKGPRFKVNCKTCGSEFHVIKSLYENPKSAKYCSRECMYNRRKGES